MASFTHHLVRRGVEELHATVNATSGDGSKQFHLPPWAIALITVTIVAFTFGYFAISYTYGEVVAHLAAVEAPSSTVILRTPPEDNKSDEADAPLLLNDEKIIQNTDQEILLVKQRALTSRFCTIKRHLKARGGKGARFRGLPVWILILFSYSFLSGIAGSIFQRVGLPLILAESVSYAALTPLTLLWTHIILSEPSKKSAMQRIAPGAIVKKAVLPTFLYAFLINLTINGVLALSFNLNMLRQLPFAPRKSITSPEQYVPILLIISVFMLFSLCVQIPAEIAMTRVRASLLSNDETPIIPFDRTFNSKVVSVEDGGSGMLNLWQGLTSCDLQTFLRVVGVHVKVFAMQTALIMFAVGVVLLEVRLIAGPDSLPAFAMYLTVNM